MNEVKTLTCLSKVTLPPYSRVRMCEYDKVVLRIAEVTEDQHVGFLDENGATINCECHVRVSGPDHFEATQWL